MTVVWSGFKNRIGLGGLAGGPHLDTAIQSTTEQIALQGRRKILYEPPPLR